MNRKAGLLATVAVAMVLAGCAGQKTAPSPTPAEEPQKKTITAFGTVQCAETLVLALPFEVSVCRTYANEGSAVPAHSPVFGIDMERLSRQRQLLEHQLDGLAARQEACRLETEHCEQQLALQQSAVDRLDVDKLIGILQKLANAGSRGQRDRHEAALLKYLEQIASVGRYHELLALALADRHGVADNARPVLMKLGEELGQDAYGLSLKLLELEEAHHKMQQDALILQEKADIMECIYNGSILAGIGSFRADGVFMTADRPLQLSSAPGYAGQEFDAGQRLMEFGSLDALEIRVLIEEQLIQGVQAGLDVQVSPLYDKSVVWLGTVESVSHSAAIANGETVIPITVSAEGMALGPGYNVITKIILTDQQRSGG